MPDANGRNRIKNMLWAAFFAGVFAGGLIGLGAMCLCVVSGDESRREEMREAELQSEIRNKET